MFLSSWDVTRVSHGPVDLYRELQKQYALTNHHVVRFNRQARLWKSAANLSHFVVETSCDTELTSVVKPSKAIG